MGTYWQVEHNAQTFFLTKHKVRLRNKLPSKCQSDTNLRGNEINEETLCKTGATRSLGLNPQLNIVIVKQQKRFHQMNLRNNKIILFMSHYTHPLITAIFIL